MTRSVVNFVYFPLGNTQLDAHQYNSSKLWVTVLRQYYYYTTAVLSLTQIVNHNQCSTLTRTVLETEYIHN